jgi:hypothetical protein
MDAVRWVKANDLMLLTSIGMQTWELEVYLAGALGVCQAIVVPASGESEFYRIKDWTRRQFGLDDRRISFVPEISAQSRQACQNRCCRRDETIVKSARVVLPVSLRPGGNLEKILDKHAGSVFVSVDRRFQIPYAPRREKLSYRLVNRVLSAEVLAEAERYLIHWTRAASGPWPAETRQEYYRAVSESDRYPRDAFDTLNHILKTGAIKASSRHMPRKTPTVSFTSASPEQMIPLFKWRSRYVQMSFEPYGIGIEKSVSLSHGIRPVVYYAARRAPDGIEPWLTQSRGVKGDWTLEREYRFLGDLDLAAIPPQHLACFCLKAEQADEMRTRYGIRAFSLLR